MAYLSKNQLMVSALVEISCQSTEFGMSAIGFQDFMKDSVGYLYSGSIADTFGDLKTLLRDAQYKVL